MRGMFGPEVSCDGIDDHETDIVSRDGHGKLVVQDMVLGLEIHGVDG